MIKLEGKDKDINNSKYSKAIKRTFRTGSESWLEYKEAVLEDSCGKVKYHEPVGVQTGSSHPARRVIL